MMMCEDKVTVGAVLWSYLHPPSAALSSRAPGGRQLNLAPLRATNWKNIQLHLAKY